MAAAAGERARILEFRGVSIAADGRRFTALEAGDLELLAGEMALIEADPGREKTPLGAAAQGLIPRGAGADAEARLSGDVMFQGRSWYDGEFRRHLADRGRVGRVFEFEPNSWVSNLSVLDNVMLARLHHTQDAAHEVLQEAEQWSRQLGLEGTPRQRPAFVADWRLRLAQCVRALVIRPTLLILEHPLRRVPEKYFEPLCQAVAKVRGAGTAILWISADARFLTPLRRLATVAYEIRGQKLLPGTGRS